MTTRQCQQGASTLSFYGQYALSIGLEAVLKHVLLVHGDQLEVQLQCLLAKRVSICGSLTNVKVGLVSLLAYFAKQHKVDGTRGSLINKMIDECWISTIIFILETPCIGPHCKHHIVCMSGQKTCHAFKKRRHVRTIGCCRMLFYLLCFQNENRKAH